MPPQTLSLPIDGLRLEASTLGEQLAASRDGRPTLLCLLRHFGCLFCREMVRDIKWASERNPSYPSVLFVGQGNAQETREFIDPVWPGVPVVCDPDRVIYKAMHLGQGSVFQMFGPSVWACGVRATMKGAFIGKTVGDPWTMPGAFLLDPDGTVLWQHAFRHQADHPDWSKLARYAAAPGIPVGAVPATIG